MLIAANFRRSNRLVVVRYVTYATDLQVSRLKQLRSVAIVLKGKNDVIITPCLVKNVMA